MVTNVKGSVSPDASEIPYTGAESAETDVEAVLDELLTAVPAAVTDISGNAGTATALETARTISISGDATGSASFDGTAGADIDLTLAGSSSDIPVVSGTTYTYISGMIAGTAADGVAINQTYYISQRLEGFLTVAWSNTSVDPSDYFDVYFNEVRQVHDYLGNDDSNNGTFSITLINGINSIRVQFYANNNNTITYNVDLKSDTDVNLAFAKIDGGAA